METNNIHSLKTRQKNYFAGTATSIILGMVIALAYFVRLLVFHLPSDRSKGLFQTADLFFYGGVVLCIVAFLVFFSKYKKEGKRISEYFLKNK